MKIKVLICFILISLFITDCDKGQYVKSTDIKNKINSNNMKKLDINKFEKYNKENVYEFIENDTLVTIKKAGDQFDYVEFKKAKNDNFYHISNYDKNKLYLKREGMTFLKMPIGKHIFYDENGMIVREVDFDEGFVLSIDELIKKMKDEFKIDLNQDIKGLRISRDISKEEKIPVYDIFVPVEESGFPKRHIRIDATSSKGTVILDRIETPQE